MILQAVSPIELSSTEAESLYTASVCVYPLRLPDAISAMKNLDKDHKISIATGW